MKLKKWHRAQISLSMVIYSFICENEKVWVLNLNDMARAVVFDKDGKVLETSMDDIEISVVLAYWEKNKQFAEE